MEKKDSTTAPTFVVGVGRSGTTLLVNLLGSHRSMAPIYETSFIKNLLSLCECRLGFGASLGAGRASRVIISCGWGENTSSSDGIMRKRATSS
jgi:hypothetical protein